MVFRLRPRGARRSDSAADASPPPADSEPRPAPEMFTGSTFEPDEGAAERISSAADVDPNIKKYGVLAGPGGAGGFGGAGTK